MGTARVAAPSGPSGTEMPMLKTVSMPTSGDAGSSGSARTPAVRSHSTYGTSWSRSSSVIAKAVWSRRMISSRRSGPRRTARNGAGMRHRLLHAREGCNAVLPLSRMLVDEKPLDPGRGRRDSSAVGSVTWGEEIAAVYDRVYADEAAADVLDPIVD